MALKHKLPNLASFPFELRRAKLWLLWKDDKVPYYTTGRRRGSYGGGLDTEVDRAHLVDAKTAYAKLKASKGAYSGLGIALIDGWYGLDFDHVVDPVTGEILPEWVAHTINHGVVRGMYAEVSPSGTGLHMIARWRGEPRFRNGKQNEHVEAYYSGRYLTMSSEVCWGVWQEGAPQPTPGTLPTLAQDIDPAPTLTVMPAGKPALRLVAEDGRQTVQNDAGAAQAGKVTSGWLADRETAVTALKSLSADCSHDEWLRVGLALHHAAKGHPEGLALWEQWSAKAAGRLNERGLPRYVPGHCATRWASFGRTAAGAAAPVTLGSLIHRAREARPEREPDAEAPTVKRTPPPGEMGDSFTMGELQAATLAPTRWVVADLIAPGCTLLAAPPKAGKSYLALQMAMSVAAGKPFLDRETTQSKVVYFDLEQGPTLIQPRMRAIAKAHAIPHGAPLGFALKMEPGEKALERMAQEIEEGAKLIIIDLFARVRDELSENEKKGVYVRDYMAISQISDFVRGYPEVACVVVHHANKGKHDNWQDKISGSNGMAGGTDANMYLSRPDLRGMDDADKDRASNYRVLHAQGKRVEEQEIVLEKMHDGGGWQCSQMKPWEISGTLLQTRLLMLLAAKWPAYTPAKDIADLLGKTFASARQLLMRMAQRGMIESEGQGGSGYRVKR